MCPLQLTWSIFPSKKIEKIEGAIHVTLQKKCDDSLTDVKISLEKGHQLFGRNNRWS